MYIRYNETPAKVCPKLNTTTYILYIYIYRLAQKLLHSLQKVISQLGRCYFDSQIH